MNISEHLSQLLKYDEQVISIYKKQIAALETHHRELQEVVLEFCELIDNSDGVTGLHLNGNVATWKELMNNGGLRNLRNHLEKQK